MPVYRVVLDTNVLVSGIVYPENAPGRILHAWNRKALQIVTSHYILAEVNRVLPRLRRVTLFRDEVLATLESLRFLAEITDPAVAAEPDLRDPKDGPILGTLLAARADYLITGDKDLIALGDKYPILTPAAFWQRHGG